VNLNWASLLVVAVVSAGVTLTIVSLVASALVGLSQRARRPARDGDAWPIPTGAGAAVAAVCLLAATAIIGFGLSIIAG
jgi:hypothetical protein